MVGFLLTNDPALVGKARSLIVTLGCGRVLRPAAAKEAAVVRGVKAGRIDVVIRGGKEDRGVVSANRVVAASEDRRCFDVNAPATKGAPTKVGRSLSSSSSSSKSGKSSRRGREPVEAERPVAVVGVDKDLERDRRSRGGALFEPLALIVVRISSGPSPTVSEMRSATSRTGSDGAGSGGMDGG